MASLAREHFLLLAEVATNSRKGGKRRWSAGVMQRSDALDLERGVFTKRSPRAVALSLKRSAERSQRKKSGPFRSAMSMLNFHINRGGKGLPASQKKVLEQAKDELRELFGRKRKAKKETKKKHRG